MTTILIAVSLPIPIDRRGRYRVYLGARLLVAGKRMLLLDAAREVTRLGADPDAIISHAGVGHDALRGRLGAAALTVEECFDGRRRSEGTPPMRQIERAYARDHDATARAAS